MATKPRRAPKTAERPPLTVLPGRRRRGRGFRPSLVPVAVVLIAAIFAIAGLQAYLSQEGFRAAKLEKTLRAEQERMAILRARLAEMSSPARLAESARALGMTEPSNPIFLPAPAEVGEGDVTRADGGAKPYGTKKVMTEAP